MPRSELNTNIPQFTANDFYETSKPYDFLYKFINNKFALNQMREKMKAMASKAGVKGFISLWNAYLETLSQKKGSIIDNATAFDGQEIELFSGKYICDDYGVMVKDKHGYELNVCSHPIMPVKRLVNIDNGFEYIKIAFKKGRSWRSVILDKAAIASRSNILQLAANGVMVNSENAQALSTYLLEMENMNYNLIPEQKSVSRLGWVGEGFSPYVDDLVFDGENNFRHIFNAVKSNGDRQKWLDAMLDLRQKKGAGRLFLAASFASVILEPCGLLPFFFHAWGGTETGKTVGLMITASVWACPKMGEYITTFNSTSVGQEMTATFLNSLPMCIDELQIQSTAGVRDFDKMIYQLTEGIGRTRGAKAGGLQKLNTWKNCIISNGEQPISNANSAGGAVNRIIEFECTEKIYDDLPGLCAIITKNYGFAGREFVEWLQQEDSIDAINAIQRDYYRALLKSDNTDKQAASASAILAADAVATALIFKDDNQLTVDEIAAIMTKKKDVDANARAYEYTLELIARNPNRFKPNGYNEYSGEVWGKIEREHIYIIKSIFDREMLTAGFNPTAFLAWAKRKDLIVADKDRRTKNARIAGSLANCVCLINQDQSEYSQFKEDGLPF